MKSIRALTLGAAIFSLAAAPPEEVPWPANKAPSTADLTAMVDDATAVHDQDRLKELAAALEDQRDDEVLELPQRSIDAGNVPKDVLKSYGHQFFHMDLSRRLGVGGIFPGSAIRRVHTGVRGGIDSFSCAGCHSVGGLDGAGSTTETALSLGDGDRASSAILRNPPAVVGTGLIQAVGAEMSEALSAQREEALKKAKASGASVSAPLSAKGISFGVLVARPDGTTDLAGVTGVSPDLVVRPFGWKGVEARLRRMVEEAARVHFGMEAVTLTERHRGSPDPARLGDGANGFDPDGDGVEREIDEGTVTATAVYLAMLEAPIIAPPHSPRLLERWGHGDRLFGEIGCASCHVRSLKLDNTRWREAADAPGSPPVVVNLLVDGDPPRGGDEVMLFSDLKRHAMGPELADPHDGEMGLPRDVFLTRPLWGLGETAPYLHDGRAATIPEAILAHGGEAKQARNAFAALPEEAQRDLHVFLLSLTRAPKVRVAE